MYFLKELKKIKNMSGKVEYQNNILIQVELTTKHQLNVLLHSFANMNHMNIDISEIIHFYL